MDYLVVEATKRMERESLEKGKRRRKMGGSLVQAKMRSQGIELDDSGIIDL
jgi:hypothetical protein